MVGNEVEYFYTKDKSLGRGVMLLKNKPAENPYYEIEEKIKRELETTLERKGIDISKIHIDLKTGNLNLSLSIKQ